MATCLLVVLCPDHGHWLLVVSYPDHGYWLLVVLCPDHGHWLQVISCPEHGHFLFFLSTMQKEIFFRTVINYSLLLVLHTKTAYELQKF